MRDRTPRAWDAGLALLLVALVAGLVWHQRLEKDEGYLSAGAWLVASGRAPYRDFIFPQQPYFPLAYGTLMRVAGPSLLAARALSGVLFLALGALLFAFLRRQEGDRALARWGTLFFCFNTLSLYWYPRARQYVLADLLLFLGFLFVAERHPPGKSRRWLWTCVLGGVAGGAAAQVRLLVGPAVVALAVAAGRGGEGRWSWRRAGAFASGVLLGSLPFLWLLAFDPSAWLRDAFSLQLMLRPSFDRGEMVSQVALSLLEFFRLPENVWLAAAAAVALLTGGQTLGASGRLAVVMLVTVGGAALATYPTQGQYLVEILPYLAVVAALGWRRLLDGLARNPSRAARLAPAGLVLALVVVGGGRAALRIASDQHSDPALGLAGLLAYQEDMRRHVGSDDDVLLTWWPGYLLVRGVTPYPGAELGRPTDRAQGRLPEREFPAWGMRHPKQVEEDLRAGVPRFVVVGYSAPEGVAGLLRAKYGLRACFPGIEVHERRDSGRGAWPDATCPS